MKKMQEREKFSSRLGFILISAGCAVGLGNVWRFPFITGQYGGAAFVLIYLFFLAVLGLPIMVMEFSVGRASQRSVACAFRKLEPKGSKWHLFGHWCIIGNYILMMFYTTISGWVLLYLFKMMRGDFVSLSPEQVGAAFDGLVSSPSLNIYGMTLAVLLGFLVCSFGLKNGVEKITKLMLSTLFIIMIILAIRSITLPGAIEGIKFYLVPDFSKMVENGIWEAIFAAMGQAFFTLSLGIGSMAIFGSYIGKDRSLTSESVYITLIDTFVALMAGLIIFPACFAFGVNPGQGPGLVFVTLPNVFNSMMGGRIWGSLFFLFMSFAAMSTVIAVFENIISFGMDLFTWSRKRAVWINTFLILILSLPCALGFSVLSNIAPLGEGSTILDLEDFIVSNNLLPLGSLIFLIFCTSKYGWGFKSFTEEANLGIGLPFPSWSKGYITYILPLIILLIFVQGYISKFFA
jgi:NSS family neurotransmitter:Na+ symporter